MSVPATCTCARPSDTHLPSLDGIGRCPACGNLLAADDTIDTATAIQSDMPPPKYHGENSPFDDDRLSIRKKSNAHPAIIGIAVAAVLIGFVTCAAYFFLSHQMVYSQRDMAKTQVKGPLTNACQAYYLKHQGQFPATLDALLVRDQFGGPYLENADELIDPWGNPYQYDIKGPRNMGTKPDIWAVASNGTFLGNWPR